MFYARIEYIPQSKNISSLCYIIKNHFLIFRSRNFHSIFFSDFYFENHSSAGSLAATHTRARLYKHVLKFKKMAAHCVNVTVAVHLSPSNPDNFQDLFRLHCGWDGLFAFPLLYSIAGSMSMFRWVPYLSSSCPNIYNSDTKFSICRESNRPHFFLMPHER